MAMAVEDVDEDDVGVHEIDALIQVCRSLSLTHTFCLST